MYPSANANVKRKWAWIEMEEEQNRFCDHVMEHINLYDLNDDNYKNACEEVPVNLKVSLLRYQKEWLAWALNQEKSGVKGGILADDMGMGKTQMIALVLAKQEILDSESCSPNSSTDLPKTKSTLVVCSPLAVTQWEKEIKKSTIEGSVKVRAYGGCNRVMSIEEFSDFDFVITTYSTVRSDCNKCSMDFREDIHGKQYTKEGTNITASRPVLHSVKWKRIVLDEAYNIRKARNYSSQCIYALESSYRWALTGTFMQNNAHKLYPLVRFLRVFPYSYIFCKQCNCSRISSQQVKCKNCRCGIANHFSWWMKYVDDPTEKNQLDRGRAKILLQHKVVKEVMLRRTKEGRASEVDLPSKIVVIRWDILDTDEKDHYDSLQSYAMEKLLEVSESRTHRMSRLKHIYSTFDKLRRVLDYPYINVDGAVKYFNFNYDVAPECEICHNPPKDLFVAPCTHAYCKACLMTVASTMRIVYCASCLQRISVDAINTSSKQKSAGATKKPSSLVDRIDRNKFKTSTKLEALREEIMFMTERDGSAKGVVFSHFTPFLDLVQYTLMMSGIKSVKMVGTGMPERKKFVRHFIQDPDCRILLLGMKAGGDSLDLTIASHVFLMDSWWNSAIEDQIQGRVHRMGQCKPVRVIRFLIKGTIEEQVFKFQNNRKARFKGAIEEKLRSTDEDHYYECLCDAMRMVYRTSSS